jgi:hypothetical protein
MRSLKIGKYSVPLWAIAVILISGIGGTLGYYVWTTLTIPFKVNEPLEVLQYPSQLSLYAGETSKFNVTVKDQASINYSVSLVFSLSNATYQTNYVTFSDEVYVVVLGVQNLTASVTVTQDAPPASLSLTVNVLRGDYPSGLIGYWKFDEGTGSVAADSSGNGNNGSIFGATWEAGKINHALQFDGIDDYVGLSSLDVHSLTSVTVAAWIKSPLTSIGYIFYQGGNGEFLLHTGNRSATKASGGNITQASFSVHLQDGAWYDVYSPAMTPNAWHYLVGVWTEGVSLKIYVDGALAGEISVPNYGLLNVGSYYRTSIGVYSWGAQQSYFEGLIDEVRVYNAALSNSEIRFLYALS